MQSQAGALPAPPPDAVEKALGVTGVTIEWLAGDGSDRCYYRLRSPDLRHSLVLMQLSEHDAVALREDGYDWVKMSALLSDRDISVPRVVATMPDHAALIIEDYGDLMLENRIFDLWEQGNRDGIEELYRQCFDILQSFLRIEPSEKAIWCQRAFDEERYLWELHFFQTKFLGGPGEITLNEAEQKQFDADIKAISKYLGGLSKYFVHRDFHSRNVMLRAEGPAIIDFQDARLGPAAYDLVSLCFDAYVPFDREFRRDLLTRGLATLAEVSLEVAEELAASWKAVFLQRQLKAIGSFGFLTVDKGKGDYLKYVAPALQTVRMETIADDRWPFISADLLDRMNKEWNGRTH